MTTALFDTNILIDLFSGRSEAMDTIERYALQRAISLVTWMEVMVGARKYHQEIQTRIALSVFEVIDISKEIAEKSVLIRLEHGMKLPDAIILATAQVHQRCLLTRNTKDFAGISGVVTPYTL